MLTLLGALYIRKLPTPNAILLPTVAYNFDCAVSPIGLSKSSARAWSSSLEVTPRVAFQELLANSNHLVSSVVLL